MDYKKPIIAALVLCASVPVAFSQTGKEFSIPMDDLKTWAEKPVAVLQVKISGHSAVHPVQNDCEMHLGGNVVGYQGDPDGWVLEPMNACAEPLPGATTYTKTGWLHFGDSVTGKTITATGIIRIWPEHLTSSGASNPAHALELHPLLAVSNGSASYDFSKLVDAPEDFPGGVSTGTAASILTHTTVTVTQSAKMAKINFISGTIGNFTTLSVRANLQNAVDIDGSYRMNGAVILDSGQDVAVKLLTSKGTAINGTIAKLIQAGKPSAQYDFLVLFSLDPVALYDAATQSQGDPVEVKEPIQLIIYGEGQAE
jgi:hypothetical protein